MGSYESGRLDCGENFIHANYKLVKSGEMTFEELVARSELSDTKVRSYIKMAKIPLEFRELCYLKDSEKNYIKENYKEMNYSEMAKNLDRSTTCVRDYCLNVLCVEAKSNIKINAEAIGELVENGKDFTAKEWAEYFGVDVTTIYTICKENNIEYKKPNNDLVEKEIEYILTNHKNLTPSKMEVGLKDLGYKRSYKTIKNFLEGRNLEIKKGKEKKEVKEVKEVKKVKENKKDFEVKELLQEVAIMDDNKIIKELENDLIDILNKYGILTNLQDKLSKNLITELENSNFEEVHNLLKEIEIVSKYMQ